MFEEDLCLQCGAKPCLSSSVYCSSECAELDAAPSSPALSPSQSTASSAFPSPSLPPSFGSFHNIPPLALDRAAQTWDDSDSDISEPAFALRYARRPSATNHRSTIPLLTHSKPTIHRRGSSSLSSDLSISPSESTHTPHQSSTATVTARKRANRASLPAHFQLLQTAAPHSPSLRAMLPSLAIPSTSPNSRSRPSPSTPKLAGPAFDRTPALAGASPSSAPMASVASTMANQERGRRREPGSSRRREPSRSVSRSRNRSRSTSRPSRDVDDDARGRRRAGTREWVGARDFGFGHGRTGLIARETDTGRGRAR